MVIMLRLKIVEAMLFMADQTQHLILVELSLRHI